jgi:tetratricopeptide (TPR) repeat protein
MTSPADESALLAALRGLVEDGRYQELLTRLDDLPREWLLQRTPFALFAAEAYGRLGNSDEAERWAGLALDVARAKGEMHAELRARNLQGAVALLRGDADRAEQYFSAALEMTSTAGDHAVEARCLNNLGIIANLRGEPEAALVWYQRALAAWRQAGQLRGMAETHHNIEISRRDLGDLQGALAATEEAMRLALELRDDALVGRALTGRADLHLRLGDVTLAAAELERAEAAYERADYPARLPEVWRLQAGVAQARGNVPAAVQLLERARAAGVEHGTAHVLADVERDLGAVLELQGDHAGARAARERALAILRRLGAAQEINALVALLG